MVGCAAMSSTVSLVALLKKVEHPKGLQVVDDVAKPVASNRMENLLQGQEVTITVRTATTAATWSNEQP